MPRSRRRASRLARLPLLLAYALMLVGSPVGEAGFLGAHLTSAHTAAPSAASATRSRDDGRRAADDAPHHHDRIGPRVPPAHGPASGHPHEHPHPSAIGHEHRHAPAAGLHAHHARRSLVTAPAELPADEPRSVAPAEPHSHGGVVHDHRSHPGGDAGHVAGAPFKYDLPPSTAAALPPPADARFAHLAIPAPHTVAARVDTPPPRVPG